MRRQGDQGNPDHGPVPGMWTNPKPGGQAVRDPAKEEAIRRELITISQQLRARGVPREARARIEERVHELQENLR